MIASVWDDCVNHLRGELPDQQFNTWIKPLKLDESEQDSLVLIAPNRFVMDWVNDKFRARIEDLVRQSVNAQLQAGTSKLVLPIELTIVAGNRPAQTSAIRRPVASSPQQHRPVPSDTGYQSGGFSSSGSNNAPYGSQANDFTSAANPAPSAELENILQANPSPVSQSSAPTTVPVDNIAPQGQEPNQQESRIITDLSQQPAQRRGTHEAIQLTLDQEVNQAFSGASSEHSHIPSSESIGSNKASVTKADVEGGIQHKSNLNNDFIFKNFVEGKSNQLALAASSQVAENPGGSYNPLFIYGGVGLGKTHLMHAVGNAYLKRSPNAKIVYLHSERFVADMVKALQLNAINDFKRYYRSVNALLIDDIQFFAGKERSQEEFFHTFNALLEGGQQIIVTSDRYPKEITGLEERLKSRFGWGLTVAIEPPELETRVAILMRKADQAKIHLPNDAAFFIAQRIRSNVRELEGALKRVIANAQFTRQPISVELVREALKDLLALQDRLVSIDNIQRIVAEYYKIKISDLHSKRRSRSVARPRQVAMYLAKELTNHSLPEIGESFGGRDHTTVLHACRKIKELITTDADIGEDVKNLLRTLTT